MVIRLENGVFHTKFRITHRIIRLRKKKYKNNNLFLEIYLLEYEGFNIYIRIDYDKKLDVYKLNWYDLESIQDKNIEKDMGSEYINRKTH